MSREKCRRLFFTGSALLVVAFFIKLAVDRHTYSTTLNSAPFYIWVIMDSLYFLLPAVIALILGFVFSRNRSGS